jgi:hypothetical protein
MSAPLLASALLLLQSGPGLGFAEARLRAERYETDRVSQTYRNEVLDPLLTPKTRPLFSRCYPASVGRRMTFTLIVSFKDGKFDRVERDSQDPVARCMAEAFEDIRWPKPPHDDFAEEFHFDLSPS